MMANNAKRIRLINTGQEFESIAEAARHFKINAGNLKTYLKKKKNGVFSAYSGRTAAGEPLMWEELDSDGVKK